MEASFWGLGFGVYVSCSKNGEPDGRENGNTNGNSGSIWRLNFSRCLFGILPLLPHCSQIVSVEYPNI